MGEDGVDRVRNDDCESKYPLLFPRVIDLAGFLNSLLPFLLRCFQSYTRVAVVAADKVKLRWFTPSRYLVRTTNEAFPAH